ncbi:MAG: hypothetical protein GXP26_03035 [Planctomycetes bacterium]|nr:hypothetical protein [Planctomycetota bacterium]
MVGRTVAALFYSGVLQNAHLYLLEAIMQGRKQFVWIGLSIGLRLAWLLALPFWVGCSAMLSSPPVEYRSLLRSVETAPDSVTLEIFQVRVPANEPELTKAIWQAVDEQRLDIEVRRELVSNEFRVGILGGAVPDELARQMNLQSEMPETTPERVITGATADPRVTRRVLQLNRHEAAIIQTSEVRDEVVVMVNSEGGVQGKRYKEVEATYSMRAERAPGQRVLLRLTPELRHGELRNRYSGSVDQGIFLATPSRERETYDRLKLSTELAAGEILVIGCQPEASGSLGHTFHGVGHGGPAEHKLVLIRLLQVPGSEILADAGDR